MKYAYTLRITESEARQLEMILQEPVKQCRPVSTIWEVITLAQQTFITPAMLLNTKKIRWTMYPSFEWRITIFLNKPILPKNTYFQISNKKIFPIEGHLYRPLLEMFTNANPLSVDFIKTSKCLVWNNKLKEFRSYDEKTRN